MEEIFTLLKGYIDTELICTYIAYGKEKQIEARLKDVIDYKAIVIGNMTIPFIGSSVAIKKIETKIHENLYENNDIDISYNNDTPEELDARKVKLFGEDYLEKYHRYLYNKYTVKYKNVK